MEALLAIVQGLSPIVQLVLVVGFLIIFWKPIAQQLGWVGEDDEKVPIWAVELLQHFNHDTTNQNDKIVQMLEQSHDMHKSTLQVLGEMQKYGLKCRND